VTAEANREYNCVASSIGRVNAWIWPPDRAGDGLAAMDLFYASLGWRRVPDPPAEGEAIALFARSGEPQHVARRVQIPPDDWWESKLGRDLRIVHRLRELESTDYGDVLGFYVRG